MQIYSHEPTGTSLQWKSEDSLPFPAISVCDHHYDYGRTHRDLGFPYNVFAPRPTGTRTHPLTVYKFLDDLGMEDEVSVMDFHWGFYYTLNKVIEPLSLDNKMTCMVGSHSCAYKVSTAVKPSSGSEDEALSIEVPAGVWTSRFFTDSDVGTTYLCHTLQPNVTVNFSVQGGNSVSLRWSRELSNASSYWDVYVHDASETVLLQSYAMETQPKLTVIPGIVKDTEVSFKKKAMIKPTKMVLPEPSDVLPCNASHHYSKNMCNIRHGWGVRFLQMEKDHGKRFDCQLPGVWVDESRKKPVCSVYYRGSDPNGTLGYFGLMGLGDEARNKNATLLSPPIGVYKDTSSCKVRCLSYTYHLVEEPVAYYDKDMQVADLYLYFASTTVETWTEYRLEGFIGFLSEIGGALGLVLGASLFSLSIMVIDGASEGLRIIKEKKMM